MALRVRVHFEFLANEQRGGLLSTLCHIAAMMQSRLEYTGIQFFVSLAGILLRRDFDLVAAKCALAFAATRLFKPSKFSCILLSDFLAFLLNERNGIPNRNELNGKLAFYCLLNCRSMKCTGLHLLHRATINISNGALAPQN